MALGLAELILFSLLVDWIARRINIPGLVGMLFVGTIMGPYALNMLKPGLLDVSSDLRMIALIVILLRAGFELSKQTLKRVGSRALLLSAIPAFFEGVTITFVAPHFINLTYMESAILGSIIAAVSPAVVVPLMIHFIEKKRGTGQGIPTLILAASSVDDVFVIVVYSVLIGFYTGAKVNIALKLASIPVSILLGIGIGLGAGLLLYRLFDRFNPRATKRLLIILGASIVLVAVEPVMEKFIPFAALLAVMAMGTIILERNEYMAHEISSRLSKVWVFAEILLFTLVGAQVDVHVALKAGLAGSAIIGIGLIARSIGTYTCLLRSPFSIKERIFIVISYIPKATVQAAIGGAPLMAMKAAGMDTAPGELILAIAVLSIILTAPIGAWAISFVGNRVLKSEISEDIDSLENSATSDDNMILRSINVADVMDSDAVLINEADELTDIFHAFSSSDYLICPVVDKNDSLKGVVLFEDLKPVVTVQKTWKSFLAHDVAKQPCMVAYPDDKISDLLREMEKLKTKQIVVIDRSTDRVVGIVDYNRAEKILQEKLFDFKKRGILG
ncbi:sodium:proton antiporter [candidate division KSB1 bacterium]|nr:MAG: sodium:proton antiporter [candidate division KSB1 bacterium]